MSSEKVVHGGEVIGRARRDRPGAARLVTVAVAAGVGVLVVAALAFLFHGVKHVRENSAQLKDQILALKDRTLAMEIKQDAAAGDKEEASSHKEEVTALKIHLSSLKTELQQEKADGASLRERLAVLETKFQLGHAEEHSFGKFREASFVVLKGRPDETGGTAVMVFPVRPGLPVRLVDVEGVEDNPANSKARLHSREESRTSQGGWAGAWCANGPLNTNQWLQPPCTAVPLGMESGAIPDGYITASTTHQVCATSEARLHSSQAWCANNPLNTNQWLQVFPGNSDQDTEVRHLLDLPVTARYVRFWPQTWNSHLSMRVEVLGQDCTGD
uniref:F5/8 type C domain-containing protein n=1 Tax=Branchiostoma floridae TaxID=7739 RepID=C3ZMN6_BRAFL|eukprot:XP_002590235.1 hypothetical protein BRAFLDRAFT_97399 [Branchiostoma floridae]